MNSTPRHNRVLGANLVIWSEGFQIQRASSDVQPQLLEVGSYGIPTGLDLCLSDVLGYWADTRRARICQCCGVLVWGCRAGGELSQASVPTATVQSRAELMGMESQRSAG